MNCPACSQDMAAGSLRVRYFAPLYWTVRVVWEPATTGDTKTFIPVRIPRPKPRSAYRCTRCETVVVPGA